MTVRNFILRSPLTQRANLRVGWTVTRIAAAEMIVKELTGGPAHRGHATTSWVLKMGGRLALSGFGALNAALRPGVLGMAVGLGVFGTATTGSVVAGLAGVGVVAGVAAAVGVAWTAGPLFLLGGWAHHRYQRAADQLIGDGVRSPALLTQALPQLWRRLGFLPQEMVDEKTFAIVRREEVSDANGTTVHLSAVNELKPWQGQSRRLQCLARASWTASPLHFMDLRTAVDLLNRISSHVNHASSEILVDRIVESVFQVYLFNFRTSLAVAGFENLDRAVDSGIVRLAPPHAGSRTMLPAALAAKLDAATIPQDQTTPLAVFSCHDSTWEFASHISALAFASARILAKGSFGKGYLGSVYGPALKVLQIPLIDRGSGRKAIGQMLALVSGMVARTCQNALQIYVAGTRTNSQTGVDGPLIPAASGGLSVIMDRGRESFVVFSYGQKGVGATAPRNSEMGVPLLVAQAAMLGIPNVGMIGPFSRARDWMEPATALARVGDPGGTEEAGAIMATKVDRHLARLTRRPIGPRPQRSKIAEALRKMGGA